MEARIAATLVLLSALASPAAAQQFELTPLDFYATPLPPPGPPVADNATNPAAVNASGQIGFDAAFGSPDEEGNYASYGVYRRTGTTTELLALTGDPLPDGSGRSFDRVSFVDIEASGDVIFLGESCEGVPLGSPSCHYGVYRATGSGLTTIVQSGQSVPDSATDTVGTISPYVISATAGRIAFATWRKPSHVNALYLWSAGALTPIATAGELAPGMGRTFSGFGLLDVNSAGTVAFLGYFEPGSEDHGAFVSANGALRTLAYTGSPEPGGGSFYHFYFVSVDEADNVAFETWAESQQGLCCDAVIFVDSAGSLRTVARSGQTIPGMQVPFFNVRRPSIHEGRVAFHGWWDNPQGSNWYGSFAEVDGTLVRVVYDGQPSPKGLPGNIVASGLPRFTPSGEILFVARYGVNTNDAAKDLFRARFAPGVPALGAPAWALAALLLALSGARAVRRASGRSARSAPRRALAACAGAGRRASA
jgi:hypothetical protein